MTKETLRKLEPDNESVPISRRYRTTMNVRELYRQTELVFTAALPYGAE